MNDALDMLNEAAGLSLEAYYDVGQKSYWIKNCQGEWIGVNETSLKRHLRKAGFSSKTGDNGFTSPLDDRLISIQTEQDILWAGPLAGADKGLKEVCEHRILVTEGPKLIEPVEGDWNIIEKLLINLFDEQLDYVLGWLKTYLQALRSGNFRPGQALAIAGEAGCGKSLFQKCIVTQLLGGRHAKPYRYLSGGTDFNAELFGSEHLMIEDEVSSTDIRKRRHFGSRIKDLVANETHSHHAKNRNAVTLRPFWRLTISLNDEAENLMILPPIDESLADKIMLLKAYKKPLPMPAATDEERRILWDTLTGELPALVYYLLNRHTIDSTFASERYGVIHYHHPDMLSALDELSPEKRLAELIDQILFASPVPDPWTGTAADLQRELSEGGFRRTAEQILTYGSAAGTYLGRLETKEPERYSRKLRKGQTWWTILPPKG